MAVLDLRPTVRRRISSVASYVVFAAIIIVLVSIADWPLFARNFLNMEVAASLWPGVIRATGNTILYTLIAFSLGLLFATALALMKMGRGPFKWFAIVFIEVFRGLPALLTLMIMAFAVPIAFNIRFPGGTITAGLIGLILVTAAYTAEILRAGIVAVPKGQREAAQSLGMTNMQTTLSVILPQAFRIVIPPLTNELVMLLKDTALLYVVGATLLTKELTMYGRDGLTRWANATPLMVVALVYLIITIPMTYLVSRLEKKMAVKQ